MLRCCNASPAIFSHVHISSSWLKIHIHLEHNIEYSSKVFFFELYTFTKCVHKSLFKLPLHKLLCSTFSIHFSRRITLPAELSAQTILIPITPTHIEAMSSHQELSSLHASLERSGSIIHTVNTAPLFLLLGKLRPHRLALVSNVVCSTVGSRTYSQSACRSRLGVFRGTSCNRDRGSWLVTCHASRLDAGEPIGVVRR